MSSRTKQAPVQALLWRLKFFHVRGLQALPARPFPVENSLVAENVSCNWLATVKTFADK